MACAPLIEVRNLRVALPLENGVLMATDGVSFSIAEGETLGLVGESGCGKTMTAQSIMRIAPRFAHTTGQILLHEAGGTTDIVALDPRGPAIRKIRGGVCAMIFQEPMSSFSPLHTIGNQIEEAILLHRTQDRAEARSIAIDMLGRVGIPRPAETIDKYPHHLSGGMRQRAMIAMALSSQPRLLIADEPTTALDVTVQAQVLRLMRELQDEFGMAILYISHDLGVIAHMADRVAVMYLGSIIETTDVRRLFSAPRHPYTQALMRAIPRIGKRSGERLEAIAGNVPIPINKPRACGFANRCPAVMPGVCDVRRPALEVVAPEHRAACFLYPEVVEAADV
ncbi:MAG: ABC transporter ATP-binding protein [Proteobacteria bacterium]|nr:ABC transporter ATP-binding protein [Pseudomonadota bacterium]